METLTLCTGFPDTEKSSSKLWETHPGQEVERLAVSAPIALQPVDVGSLIFHTSLSGYSCTDTRNPMRQTKLPLCISHRFSTSFRSDLFSCKWILVVLPSLCTPRDQVKPLFYFVIIEDCVHHNYDGPRNRNRSQRCLPSPICELP
jgi:hypothetical protein